MPRRCFAPSRAFAWRPVLVAGVVLAATSRAALAQDDDPVRREGFFYQQRAFPGDRIPANAQIGRAHV